MLAYQIDATRSMNILQSRCQSQILSVINNITLVLAASCQIVISGYNKEIFYKICTATASGNGCLRHEGV